VGRSLSEWGPMGADGKLTSAGRLHCQRLEESHSEAEHGSDTNVLVSRLNIVDLPSCEILNEDPEALRVKQGSTLNRGI
jgi:hypothetical protein